AERRREERRHQPALRPRRRAGQRDRPRRAGQGRGAGQGEWLVADDARTIRIRCDTWDQVESFYTEKVKGNTLVVKMPQKPTVGGNATVALGVPPGAVCRA